MDAEAPLVSGRQGVVISGLEFMHKIPSSVEWDEQQVGDGLQNFLICVEMAGFAVAHRCFFSYRDFEADWRAARADGIATPSAG